MPFRTRQGIGETMNAVSGESDTHGGQHLAVACPRETRAWVTVRIQQQCSSHLIPRRLYRV